MRLYIKLYCGGGGGGGGCLLIIIVWFQISLKKQQNRIKKFIQLFINFKIFYNCLMCTYEDDSGTVHMFYYDYFCYLFITNTLNGFFFLFCFSVFNKNSLTQSRI